MAEKKLITAKDLAEALGVSVETIWRYTRAKRIPYLEIGPQRYRYVKEEVLSALQRGQIVSEEDASYLPKTKMTYKEFAKLPPETGCTLQLIDGILVREPSPTYQHQRVSRRLQRLLVNYFEKEDPAGEVFNAPLDVYLDDYTVVQPDLFYLPGTRPAQNNPVDSLPLLVVEILSPSTAGTDRVQKLNSYQNAGIEHYWLVNPLENTIECLKLSEGKYAVLLTLGDGNLKHPDFPGLIVDLAALFKEPEMQ
ncbi:MAG TPA: helix-turn-helix domain-containing protein [Firmicutes bacterium]|nr:helix-turn-helix domain-containing protein [Bacillota bacterium]